VIEPLERLVQQVGGSSEFALTFHNGEFTWAKPVMKWMQQRSKKVMDAFFDQPEALAVGGALLGHTSFSLRGNLLYNTITPTTEFQSAPRSPSSASSYPSSSSSSSSLSPSSSFSATEAERWRTGWDAKRATLKSVPESSIPSYRTLVDSLNTPSVADHLVLMIRQSRIYEKDGTTGARMEQSIRSRLTPRSLPFSWPAHPFRIRFSSTALCVPTFLTHRWTSTCSG